MQSRLRYLLCSIAFVLFVNVASAGSPSQEYETDLLIVGGTESGGAAAVQAARMGVKRIMLVNDIDWLGGQFSAEGLVAIDENRGPEGYGHGVPVPRHGMFREVITRIENLNQQKYGVARPGNTRVITTCRPADAAKVFEELVQPYVQTGQVQIIRRAVPITAVVKEEGHKLQSVRFRSIDTKEEFTIQAKLTIDASDWGDVIKLAGAAYEFGPDLKEKYNEPEAPASRDKYPITDMNPITYCVVIEETDKYEPIPKPPRYDERNYSQHRWPKDPLWLYESRRVIDHYHFQQIKHPDVVLLCFPAIDYPLDTLPLNVVQALEADEPGASKKNIVQMTRRQRQIIFDDAKQYSLGFLYDLQTRIHDKMKDQTHSFRRFRLTDEFSTKDQLPPKPYVRESLRLKAMYMMRQQDVLGWRSNSKNYANVVYPDSVAAWQFEFDFHPTRREFLNNGDPSGPWRSNFRPLRNWGPPYSGRATFPVRSLIPETVNGLLGCQHNLGFSSIVSSAFRLHDHMLAVGQATGATAAVALQHDVPPRNIPFDATLLAKLQMGLCTKYDNGEPAMLWPFGDLEPEHPAFTAVNLLAIRGAFPLKPFEGEFHAGQPASTEWRKQVVERSLATKLVTTPPEPPSGKITRGEFAMAWWAAIKELPEKPWQRTSPQDADGDGLTDREDALPFHTDSSSWPNAKLPPDQDGVPDTLPEIAELVGQWNFTGKTDREIKGYSSDTGESFDSKRGWGWSRDLTANHRSRGRFPGEPRDTFLFTRELDRWECTVPNGTYRVTVCVGDAGFEQVDQRVTVEGQVMVDDVTTGIGEYYERTIAVAVKDGRLTVELGQKDRTRNTCLNWLRIVRKESIANP